MGEHEFCADPVGAGHEDRFPITTRRQCEQPAKAAEPGQHFRPERLFYERLDFLDEVVTGVDIDPGVLIGQRLHRRYNRAWASIGKPPLLRVILAILLAAIVTQPATAVEVTSLYTAQVPLDEEQDDPRAAAYRAALELVLLRVSGADLVADPEMVELLFPDPSAYIVQFRPGEEDSLSVTFDGEAIESLLRQYGQNVWGGDRPLTLIWLAVDWGRGKREILGADDPERTESAARSIDRNRLLRQRLLDIAERRGLPVLFPLLDTEELQSVSFSDIWGGFDEAVLEASKRYDVDSVLIGRVRPDNVRQNRWRYYFSGEQRNWIGEPELAVSQVADVLAAEFAISGSERLEVVDLIVDGIDSVNAYGAVHAILADVRVIENFAVAEVEGDRIRYRVDVHGGAERLRRALRFNGLIEQNGIDPLNSPDQRLEFFYTP